MPQNLCYLKKYFSDHIYTKHNWKIADRDVKIKLNKQKNSSWDDLNNGNLHSNVFRKI